MLGQGPGDDGAKDAPKVEPAVNEIMFKAMVEDDIQLLEEALARGAAPNALNEERISALRWAILGSGTAKTVYGQVNMLLAAGVDPNRQDERGDTPMHAAAFDFDAQESLISALIRSGGDPNIPNHAGETAYETALKWGNTGAVSAIEQALDFRHPNREELMLWGRFSKKIKTFLAKDLPAGEERDAGIKEINQFLVDHGLLDLEDKEQFDIDSIAAFDNCCGTTEGH